MKIRLILLILCLSVACNSNAKKKEPIIGYDIEYSGAEGVSGTYMIQVWINTTKATLSTEEFKRYAVEGILFKGYARPQQERVAPMVSDAIRQAKSDFFNAFFENGDYSKYASVLGNTVKNLKITKKEYRLGMIISISESQLRKDLEEAGIISKLGGNIF